MVSHHITSDPGPQFALALWAATSDLLGVEHHLTSVYHPEATRLIEQLYRTLKVALHACFCLPSWTDKLPMCPAKPVNCSVDTGCSTVDLVLHRVSPLLFEMVLQTLALPSLPMMIHHHQKSSVVAVTQNSLQSCDFVFLREDAV